MNKRYIYLYLGLIKYKEYVHTNVRLLENVVSSVNMNCGVGAQYAELLGLKRPSLNN